MPRLVVLDLPGGPAFVDALRRAWDAGDAVFPLDPRLPGPAARALLATARVDEPVEDCDALVVATSGSAGAPKGVVLSAEAVGAAARAVSARLDIDPGRDRWLACLPLSHVGGLGVVVRALLTATPLEVHAGFDAAAVDAAARRGATRTALVPTAYARVDPSPWRTVLLGGAPAPGPAPSNVVRTYGLTESGGGVVYDGVPLDGVQVRIGEGGQILLRGPTLLRAYRDGTDPKTPDGWLPTGDAGQLDVTGRLHVHGRLSDVVISGGENVWPAAVERVLRTHPGVAACAVGGRPDHEWGERVVAWVVAADPARPPTLRALRDHVKERLPAYCAPRELILTPDLPHTRSGKVRPPAAAEGVGTGSSAAAPSTRAGRPGAMSG